MPRASSARSRLAVAFEQRHEWRDPGHRPGPPSVSILSDFSPHPQNLPHNRPVLPAGNAPESFESGGGSALPSCG